MIYDSVELVRIWLSANQRERRLNLAVMSRVTTLNILNPMGIRLNYYLTQKVEHFIFNHEYKNETEGAQVRSEGALPPCGAGPATERSLHSFEWQQRQPISVKCLRALLWPGVKGLARPAMGSSPPTSQD